MIHYSFRFFFVLSPRPKVPAPLGLCFELKSLSLFRFCLELDFPFCPISSLVPCSLVSRRGTGSAGADFDAPPVEETSFSLLSRASMFLRVINIFLIFSSSNRSGSFLPASPPPTFPPNRADMCRSVPVARATAVRASAKVWSSILPSFPPLEVLPLPSSFPTPLAFRSSSLRKGMR